jgi:hypothetical protein
MWLEVSISKMINVLKEGMIMLMKLRIDAQERANIAG